MSDKKLLCLLGHLSQDIQTEFADYGFKNYLREVDNTNINLSFIQIKCFRIVI